MISIDNIEQLRIRYRQGVRTVWANVWGGGYLGNRGMIGVYHTSQDAAFSAQLGPAPRQQNVLYRLRIRFKEGAKL
jgi:hypothetical protein